MKKKTDTVLECIIIFPVKSIEVPNNDQTNNLIHVNFIIVMEFHFKCY